MDNSSVKYYTLFLTTITIASFFISSILFTYSQIAYSTSLPSLSESLQENQQDLKSVINKQVQQTITNTVENVGNGNNNNNNNNNNGSSSGLNINNINSENVSQQSINTTETKKVTVGDIDIAYKIFGKGDPLLLIPGFSMTMDMWDPTMLGELSSNHTIILFDNRGMGKTTVGNATWSIEQFANDTAGLIDTLQIQKPVDILGTSWGGYVAQELTLSYPQKVNKLMLYGTDCGGNTTIISPQITPELAESIETGNISFEDFMPLFFPQEWLNEQENAAYVMSIFSAIPTMSFDNATKENIQHQAQTTYDWKGACDRLSSLTKPTLVLTGTDDIIRPPVNSILLAEKIPGAWLIQIENGGHGIMYQYPDKMVRILNTFFETTD